MEKAMTINEMTNKMVEKDYDMFDMLCFGGTRSIFEIEDLRDKVAYVDDKAIVIIDKKLIPQMGCVSRVWDKRLILDRIEEKGLGKNPSLINEDTLKEIFEVNHDGRLYIRENSDGRLEAMSGFELEA